MGRTTTPSLGIRQFRSGVNAGALSSRAVARHARSPKDIPRAQVSGVRFAASEASSTQSIVNFALCGLAALRNELIHCGGVGSDQPQNS
jgi:hypothetical protein